MQSAHNYISIFTLPMGSLFCCFPLCVSLVHLIENKIITILHVGFYLDLQVENQLIPLTEAHLFSQYKCSWNMGYIPGALLKFHLIHEIHF